MNQTQFDALTTYIDAAIDLAVAKADYHQAEHDYGSMGYWHEEKRLREARDAARAALVEPDADCT